MEINTLEVSGFYTAFHGMRNPMDSWNKADSDWCWIGGKYGDQELNTVIGFKIGEKDKDLSQRLQVAGPEHCKHLRMIHVSADIDAPRYWWTEFDTYRAGVEKYSCSTMHRIHAREFTHDDFAHGHVIGRGWSEADNFNGAKPEDALNTTIAMLNQCREKYLVCKEIKDIGRAKMFWWQLIQLLPQSYYQRRTVKMSYAALRNICRQREGHKLDEWHQFIDWAKSLPESWMIFE